MNIQSVGKLLLRYGIPLVIGAMLVFGLIFTSLQTGASLPASQGAKTSTIPQRRLRINQTAQASPVGENSTQIAQAPTEADLPLPAETELWLADGTPTEAVTNPAGEPQTTAQLTQAPEPTSPRAATGPVATPGNPGQPANTPTVTSTPLATEVGVAIVSGPPLREPRARHTMTRLLDGKVLLVGGSRSANQYLNNVDLFDPASSVFSQLDAIAPGRHDHTATLLDDGRVMVVGGYTLPDQWLDDAAFYDFNTSGWMNAPPFFPHGTAHTSTLLDDGRVLVVGGCTDSEVCTEMVEIFDPSTDEWTDVTPLGYDLYGHTAQLLYDGRVLVIGGMSADGIRPEDNAVIYDPFQDTWTTTEPMADPRFLAQSVRLADGRVLVVGGLSLEALPEHRTLLTAELYDPDTNEWTPAGDLSQPRYAFQLVKLSDRYMLAIGGTRVYESSWNATSFVSEIERYDVTTNRWRTIGLLPRPTAFASSALLADGRVWLTGGMNNTTYFQDTWLITSPQ